MFWDVRLPNNLAGNYFEKKQIQKIILNMSLMTKIYQEEQEDLWLQHRCLILRISKYSQLYQTIPTQTFWHKVSLKWKSNFNAPGNMDIVRETELRYSTCYSSKMHFKALEIDQRNVNYRLVLFVVILKTNIPQCINILWDKLTLKPFQGSQLNTYS